ncbi:hypothetical protein MLD52_22590 [Puniceicoccaceae bacterium K14]|nr:hypothetical protein [Puniceicoccaceae bacterium K14]
MKNLIYVLLLSILPISHAHQLDTFFVKNALAFFDLENELLESFGEVQLFVLNKIGKGSSREDLREYVKERMQGRFNNPVLYEIPDSNDRALSFYFPASENTREVSFFFIYANEKLESVNFSLGFIPSNVISEKDVIDLEFKIALCPKVERSYSSKVKARGVTHQKSNNDK